MADLTLDKRHTALLIADFYADADYRLIIVEDCCADRDAAVHDFLCQKIFPYQADVVQSSDVVRALA